MAFATLEDGTAKLDLVIFPKLYQAVKSFLQANTAYLIRGQVNLREENLSLIVTQIFPPDSAPSPSSPGSSFDLLIPRGTPKPVLEQLSQLLRSHPGTDTLILVLPNGGSEVKRLKLPYAVGWHKDLKDQVQALLSATP